MSLALSSQAFSEQIFDAQSAVQGAKKQFEECMDGIPEDGPLAKSRWIKRAKNLAKTQDEANLAYQLKGIVVAASAAGNGTCSDIVKKIVSKMDDDNRTKAYECFESIPKTNSRGLAAITTISPLIRLGDGQLYMVSNHNPVALFLGHQKNATMYYEMVLKKCKTSS